MDHDIVRVVGVYAGTFVVCAAGGLLPLVNCEVYLLVVADGLVLSSAFSGIPPFYVVSVGAGAMGWNLPRFVVMGTGGRLLRFGLVTAVPVIMREAWR